MKVPNDIVKQAVEFALREDIGQGDITADLISEKINGQGMIKTREAGVICGVDWVECAFASVSDKITIHWHKRDGDSVRPNDVICELTGPLAKMLSAERTAMNFLQTLSGTASLTQQYVQALAGFDCRLLDTRKTLPGLRYAQKYAVRCGGGENHRMGLYDAYLIKENHIQAIGDLAQTLDLVKEITDGKRIEIEVETLDQLATCLQHELDVIMLDNFTVAQIQQAVVLRDQMDAQHGRYTELEASGNITLKNIQIVAACGVDMISVGALTKDIHALDLSMDIRQR